MEIIKGKKSKKGGPVKIIIILSLLTLFILLVVLVIVPPLLMRDMIKGPISFSQTYEASAYGLISERLDLKTRDGLSIVAYEVYTPNPRAVVIFLSGIHHPSVTAFFGHAEMLYEQGYSSILVEMRAHGESEGDVIALGYKEYLDTEAAVNYIEEKREYEDTPIVVFGLSMGGATAINSIGNIPNIHGLISLSAFSSWDDVFYDNMLAMGLPKIYAQLQRPFVRLYTTYKFGWSTRGITPKNSIQKLGDRPALLLHSKGDSQVPFQSFQRLLEKAPDHVETWVREGDHHFVIENDRFLHPQEDEEYSKVILGFLESHYGSGSVQ